MIGTYIWRVILVSTNVGSNTIKTSCVTWNRESNGYHVTYYIFCKNKKNLRITPIKSLKFKSSVKMKNEHEQRLIVQCVNPNPNPNPYKI